MIAVWSYPSAVQTLLSRAHTVIYVSSYCQYEDILLKSWPAVPWPRMLTYADVC